MQGPIELFGSTRHTGLSSMCLNSNPKPQSAFSATGARSARCPDIQVPLGEDGRFQFLVLSMITCRLSGWGECRQAPLPVRGSWCIYCDETAAQFPGRRKRRHVGAGGLEQEAEHWDALRTLFTIPQLEHILLDRWERLKPPLDFHTCRICTASQTPRD